MLMRSVSYTSFINMNQIYLFRMFEEASYFLEESRLQLNRRCRGVLGDQSEYDSQGRWEIDILDVLARTVLVLDQNGKDLIPNDSSSIASRDVLDDWVHSSWSSLSPYLGAIYLRGDGQVLDLCTISAGTCTLTCDA